MKKLFFILTLSIGLMSFTFSNSTIKEELPPSNFDQCDGLATMIGDYYGLSYYDEWVVFDNCMTSSGE
ncbi:hypothetical protein [Tenacibaculum finnmarkense]|uniref:hypothetical protein n=1 Tax=Tenacibaculum finnmarkense TaxID=2781243 RepID=UPI001E645A19|nr:hypothetical protein [Tenacibaculum finnmarkense]MCD8423405.1 hypothetical protein [Tenacibaculum finnmarkense genomovar ulcerans]MCG8239627.1 hypothetical protein [Tenacibaculum finnmarkense genomovar ulcerans]